LPVAELPARLAQAVAQPSGELWIGDAHDPAPLQPAAVGVSPGTALAAIGESLAAVPELAASGPVTVVSDSLLARSAVAQLEADHPVIALERAGAAEALASVQA